MRRILCNASSEILLNGRSVWPTRVAPLALLCGVIVQVQVRGGSTSVFSPRPEYSGGKWVLGLRDVVDELSRALQAQEPRACLAVMIVDVTEMGDCAPAGYRTSRCLSPLRPGCSKDSPG